MSGGDNIEPGKLFIGGLSWDTDKDSLEIYFGNYGEVIDATIMTDSQTKKPRGFGFVTFKNPEIAKHVVSDVKVHHLDGKQIDPKHATLKPSQSARGCRSDNTTTKKVFLGGLHTDTTKEEIAAYFSEFGVEVKEVDLKYDKYTSQMRGFGFLTLDSCVDADKICCTHFHTIKGKPVEAKKADPKLPTGSAPLPQPGNYHPGSQVYDYNSGWAQQQSQYPGGAYGYNYSQPARGYQGSYGGQTGGYGTSGTYSGAGGGSYDTYSQQPSVQQQQGSSYPDPSYSNTYGSSRTADTSSYPAQQQQYHQPYSQGYGTSTGTAGGRGQQTPQNNYGFGGGMH